MDERDIKNELEEHGDKARRGYENTRQRGEGLSQILQKNRRAASELARKFAGNLGSSESMVRAV